MNPAFFIPGSTTTQCALSINSWGYHCRRKPSSCQPARRLKRLGGFRTRPDSTSRLTADYGGVFHRQSVLWRISHTEILACLDCPGGLSKRKAVWQQVLFPLAHETNGVAYRLGYE